MGLDCYVHCKSNNEFDEEIGYFRKFWKLHNWFVEKFVEAGGQPCREDGFNRVNIPITKEMLRCLISDVIEKQGTFSDVELWEIEQIFGQIPRWIYEIEAGNEIYYYGCY